MSVCVSVRTTENVLCRRAGTVQHFMDGVYAAYVHAEGCCAEGPLTHTFESLKTHADWVGTRLAGLWPCVACSCGS